MSDEITSNTPEGGSDQGAPTRPQIRDSGGAMRDMSDSESKLYYAALERKHVSPERWQLQDVEPKDEDKAPDRKEADAKAPSEARVQDGEPSSANAKGGYDLDVPAEVPSQHLDMMQGNLEEIGAIGKELGIPPETLQMFVDESVALAVMDQSGVNIEDPNACMNVLRNRIGGEEADRVVADAQDAVDQLGEKVRAFLRRTGWGNDPSVLQTLARWQRGEFKMSPAQAQAEIDKLTKGEDLRSKPYYNANDPKHRATKDRVRFLYSLANREAKGAEPKSEAKPEPKAAAKTKASKETVSLQKELQVLIRHPAYMKREHPEHASVTAKAEAIYAKLYPEE